MPNFNLYSNNNNNYYETTHASTLPSIDLPSYTTSTTAFMSFEYPNNYFVTPESQDSFLAGQVTQPSPTSSICSFDPCLNYGNCVPLTNSNSMFKFRCICPENYNGILCENSASSQHRGAHSICFKLYNLLFELLLCLKFSQGKRVQLWVELLFRFVFHRTSINTFAFDNFYNQHHYYYY